jgi:hypothetical protein
VQPRNKLLFSILLVLCFAHVQLRGSVLDRTPISGNGRPKPHPHFVNEKGNSPDDPNFVGEGW